MNSTADLLKKGAELLLDYYIEEKPVSESSLLNILLLIKKCTLCNAAEKKNIFPRGNIKSQIMILLDNPAIYNNYPAEEIETIFTKMFNAINIDLNNLYISFLPKCNLQPTEDLNKNCRNLILKEINLLRIKYIISFGKTSANILLNNDFSIEKIRKQNFYEIDNLKIVSTYHPMDYLPENNKSMKIDIWNDVKLFNKILKSENVLRNSHTYSG